MINYGWTNYKTYLQITLSVYMAYKNHTE